MKDKEKAKNKNIPFFLLLFLVGSLQVQNRQDIVSTWRVHTANHQGALFALAEGAAEFSADCMSAAMFNTSHSFMWVSDFDQTKTHKASEILNFTPNVVQTFMYTLSDVSTVITRHYNIF